MNEFEQLLSAVLEGRADAAQRQRLETMLQESPELRVAYVQQMRVHALLQFRAGVPVAVPADAPAAVPANVVEWPWRSWFGWATAAAAAVVVVAATATWLALRQPAVRAQVVEARDVAGVFQDGQQVQLQTLRLAGGSVGFRLDSGAMVRVTGPAEVEFVDAMRLRVRRGRVSADIGKEAKGFSIETAQARVVDYGTKFGVDVPDPSHTDVIVFQGEVRVFNKQAPVATLTTGEAVRVDKSRRLYRIVNVTSDGREEAWSTGGALAPNVVITAVRDNMEGDYPSLRNFYRIVPRGMREDARAYADFPHEWNGLDANGIPAWLRGADLVQTFNADQVNWFMELTVTVSRPCVLYVFADRRNPPPTWLRERFTDTGVNVGWEYIDPKNKIFAAKWPERGHTVFPFGVWKLEVHQPGEVKLGPPYFEQIRDPNEVRPNWMYGIAAKPLS